MKIRLWQLIIVSVVLILISFMVIRHLSNANQTLTFLVSKRNYSLILTNANQTFDIPIYVSKKNTMYTSIHTIESVYLTNHNQSDIVQLEVVGIQQKKQETTIDSNRFYEYTFTLKTNIEYTYVLDIIHFNSASVRMLYQNGEEITLFIGNVSLTKIDKLGTLDLIDNDIKITNLKGLVNRVDDIDTLVGMEIQLEKQCLENVNIRYIGLIHNHVGVNYDLIQVNKPIDFHNQPAQEVFGTSFHVYNKGEKESLEYILDTNIVRLTIPLYYYDLISFENELGIYIVYEIDSEVRHYIYGTFCFFNTSNRTHEWVKYEYERN